MEWIGVVLLLTCFGVSWQINEIRKDFLSVFNHIQHQLNQTNEHLQDIACNGTSHAAAEAVNHLNSIDSHLLDLLREHEEPD